MILISSVPNFFGIKNILTLLVIVSEGDGDGDWTENYLSPLFFSTLIIPGVATFNKSDVNSG